jgi:transcriptional regulator with XRE-family HTH domain
MHMTVQEQDTLQIRQQLGARARLRRRAIGLRQTDVASTIGIAAAKFRAIEQTLPEHQDVDAAWEAALEVPQGWLRDAAALSAPIERFKACGNNTARPAVLIMLDVFVWFARPKAGDRTRDISNLNFSELRAVSIMLHRYGAMGEHLASLQAAGDGYGVTRQYAMIIADQVTARIEEEGLPRHLFDHIRDLATPHLPATVDQLNEKLRPHLGPKLSIEGVERFAHDFLSCAIVRFDKTRGLQANTRLATGDSDDDASLVRAVREVSLAMIRSVGAAHVYFVAGASSEKVGRGVTPEEVIKCASMVAGFEWLLESDGWFWLGHANENRVKTCAMKVLHVADRNVDVEEIAGALARAFKTRYGQEVTRPYLIAAPTAVLTEVLSRLPGVETIQHKKFRMGERAGDALNDELLSESEAKVVEVMRAHGSVVTRSQLTSQLVDTGLVAAPSLDQVLYNSPVVKALDFGYWTVVGTTLTTRPELKPLPSPMSREGMAKAAVALPNEGEEGWLRFEVTVPTSAFRVTGAKWVLPVKLAAVLTSGAYTVNGFADPAVFKGPEMGGPRLHRFLLKVAPPGRTSPARLDLRVHPEKREMYFSILDIEESQLPYHRRPAGAPVPASRGSRNISAPAQ